MRMVAESALATAMELELVGDLSAVGQHAGAHLEFQRAPDARGGTH